MNQVFKLEERTEQFIHWYHRLKGDARFITNKQLAKILGIKSVSSITEVLKKRQNIQPEHWAKFKAHFRITDKPVKFVQMTGHLSPETEVDFYRNEVMSSLEKIYNHVTGVRAEVRGSIEYQAMKDARGNDEKRREIMEQINKLIDLNLPEQ